MLLQQDPFRDLDRFSRQVFGTAARPTVMPLDAWREGDDFVVELDLPGVRPERIDIDVERNVLTVRAERAGHLPEGADPVAAERQWGVFSRQLVLGGLVPAALGDDQVDGKGACERGGADEARGGERLAAQGPADRADDRAADGGRDEEARYVFPANR